MNRISLKLLLLWFLVAASIASPVRPQAASGDGSNVSPALKMDLERLRDKALASDYAWRQLAYLTENIGPRVSGSAQAAVAVDYVSGELKRLGLEVKLEPVMVPHWVRGEEHAELVSYPGETRGITQKIVLTALGNSSPTPQEGITAEIVVADTFDELKALGREKVSGRIVLFNEKFDERMALGGHAGEAYEQAVVYRAQGAELAKSLGAVASLVRSVGGADYRIPHTGYSKAAGIPAAAVSAEDAELIAHLAAQGPVKIHLVLTPETLPDAASANVIADFPGREHPEEIVIVSGHLDSWDLGRGAIDDGAGVAVAMETAHLLAEIGLHPRRTIRVIAWMDEENGASGSRAYLADYKDSLSKHVAAIESDSGAGHPMGVRGNFSPGVGHALEFLNEIFRPIGATLFRNTGSAEADVDPLATAGVPVFGLDQDARTYFNYHHTAADTLDKVDPRELSENAAVMAVLAYAIADLPEPLARNPVQK